jgi:hypothetical protein
MQDFLFVFLTVTGSVVIIGALIYWLDKGASRHERSGNS